MNSLTRLALCTLALLSAFLARPVRAQSLLSEQQHRNTLTVYANGVPVITSRAPLTPRCLQATRMLVQSQPAGSVLVVYQGPAVGAALGGGATTGDHGDAGTGGIVIAPADPDSCSGRHTGPGGSYLPVSSQSTRTYAGLPNVDPNGNVLTEGCMATRATVAYENRDPNTPGWFVAGPLTIHCAVDTFSHRTEFDLLSNGFLQMADIPAFDGVDDQDGTSGITFTTAPRGTFFQYTRPASDGDFSQPFETTVTFTFSTYGYDSLSPCTMACDGESRGGLTYAAL